jgi:hypothetical protein
MAKIVWNPNDVNRMIEGVTAKKLDKASKILRAATKRRLAAQIGKGKTTGINRPVYLTGAYAGEKWTAREFGSMMNSVRISRKKIGRNKKALSKKQNVRVYAGHYLVWYASIFEFYRPFMRPALNDSLPMIWSILRQPGWGELEHGNYEG